MVDLRVVDENMADVPHDGEAVGEIVVRTPWLTTGYLNNPEASEVLWGGGYLHTGDVASIDADGYIRISDRLNDIVKSGGEWIPHRSRSRTSSWRKRASSARRSSPSRTSSGANGRWRWSCSNPDHVGKIGEDDIRLHVASFVERGLISKIAIPENVKFTDDLPLTSVGKVDKKKLRADYL